MLQLVRLLYNYPQIVNIMNYELINSLPQDLYWGLEKGSKKHVRNVFKKSTT